MNPGVEKKTVSEGVKPIESLPRIFCGLVIHIKNTFCKKIGSKRSFQPSAVVRAIYPPSIWGPSRQLDDQHRNTNMNNKDHLVGQLTRLSPSKRAVKTITCFQDLPNYTQSEIFTLLTIFKHLIRHPRECIR